MGLRSDSQVRDVNKGIGQGGGAERAARTGEAALGRQGGVRRRRRWGFDPELRELLMVARGLCTVMTVVLRQGARRREADSKGLAVAIWGRCGIVNVLLVFSFGLHYRHRLRRGEDRAVGDDVMELTAVLRL